MTSDDSGPPRWIVCDSKEREKEGNESDNTSNKRRKTTFAIIKFQGFLAHFAFLSVRGTHIINKTTFKLMRYYNILLSKKKEQRNKTSIE